MDKSESIQLSNSKLAIPSRATIELDRISDRNMMSNTAVAHWMSIIGNVVIFFNVQFVYFYLREVYFCSYSCYRKMLFSYKNLFFRVKVKYVKCKISTQ